MGACATKGGPDLPLPDDYDPDNPDGVGGADMGSSTMNPLSGATRPRKKVTTRPPTRSWRHIPSLV